jgi:co-chaperonin GroES (HSP10)
MARIRKDLIVVGDRLLIRPHQGEERTGAGLYLPQTAVNEQEVRGGRVVKVGPGYPIPDPIDSGEAWKAHDSSAQPRYLPLQAREGDYALFLKKAAIEISYENEKYLIVPNSAVLVLAREEIDLDHAFGTESQS